MIWLLVFVLLLGVVVGLAVYYRTMRSRHLRAIAHAPAPNAMLYWGKAFVVPDPANACQHALDLFGHRFAYGKAPDIPLPGCDWSQCACRYLDLVEQRSGKERRSGEERREHIRFEDRKERRCGRDRRSKEHYDWRFTP